MTTQTLTTHLMRWAVIPSNMIGYHRVGMREVASIAKLAVAYDEKGRGRGRGRR